MRPRWWMGVPGVVGHLGGRLSLLRGSWQKGYGRLAAKPAWGRRRRAPAHLCSSRVNLFGKRSRKHAHTNARARTLSAGFSPDLLNLASDSGTRYWKSCRRFYAFDLVGEKYCKGYQQGRGGAAYCFPSVHLHLRSQANTCFNQQLTDPVKAAFHR